MPPVARDTGIRVRTYPNLEQEARLSKMMEARHGVWNLVCERFARHRECVRDARSKGSDPPPGPTRSTLARELRALRETPGREPLKVLTLWSTQRALGDAWKARTRAFEGHARWPRRKGWRRGGPGTVAVPYEGRVSDPHYVPDKQVPLKGLGTLRIRTGAGHMPERIADWPTMTVTRGATARLPSKIPSGKIRRIRDPIPTSGRPTAVRQEKAR